MQLIQNSRPDTLCFTKDNVPQIESIAKELGLPITQIGEIAAKESGISVLDENGKVIPLKVEGFEHFK